MKRSHVLLLASGTVALAACGGVTQTPQQAAKSTVCTATADIGAASSDIPANIVSPGTRDDVAAQLTSIGNDLTAIRSALPALAPNQRAPVALAAGAYTRQIVPVALDLRATPDGPVSLPRYLKFVAAQQKPVPIFNATLAKLPC